MNATPSLPEPWLRGTLSEVKAVPRAVLHALELAGEDLNKWCAPLTESQLNAQPHGLPSVAFQLRHIARSIDRLLTYAEGNALSAEQLDALRQESQPGASSRSLFDELSSALEHAAHRVRALANSDPEHSAIGRQEGAAYHARRPPRSHRRPHPTPRRPSDHHYENSSRRSRTPLNRQRQIPHPPPHNLHPIEFGYTPQPGGGVAARSGRNHNPLSQRSLSHRQSAGRQPDFSRFDAGIFPGVTSPALAAHRAQQFYPPGRFGTGRHSHSGVLRNFASGCASRRRHDRDRHRLAHAPAKRR